MAELELDDIDRQILRLLQENSRITLADMARDIGEMTENAIRYRIDKLESEGFISDYTIRLNPKKFGKKITTIFHLNVLPEKIPGALKKLKSMSNLTEVYLTAGSYSIIAIGYFSNHEEISNFITQDLKGIKMTDYDVLTVLEKEKHELYSI
jgi:DNA-binding Lrp family transcriptional regulator